MKVVGFAGHSGSGKTTLVEKLIAGLRKVGHRVSVVKHAHHAFDIDHVGKDSWRHRAAGSFEVVVASNRRLAMIREFEAPTELTVHHLIAELSACDWVLVEGFKHADVPKIEVWRAALNEPAFYPCDPFVVAICTDSPAKLPLPTALAVLDLNQAGAVVDFLLANASSYEYQPPEEFTAADADPG